MQPLTAWFEKVKELQNPNRLRSLVMFCDNGQQNARVTLRNACTMDRPDQKKLSEANFYPDEYEKLMHTKMYLELINTDIWKKLVY